MTKSQQAIEISPSLLSANLLRLEEDLKDIETAGAGSVHIDVMDGHFVPNLTFGLPLIRAVKSATKLPLDVHIMITNPESTALDYIAAGADRLYFHAETAFHSVRLLDAIRDKGCAAGVAINPGTSLELIRPLVPFMDRILVMSVNPGFGGQKFIQESISRIKSLHTMFTETGRSDNIVIEVDGGIDANNIGSLYRAGARAFVAGTSVLGQKNRAEAISKLYASAK